MMHGVGFWVALRSTGLKRDADAPEAPRTATPPAHLDDAGAEEQPHGRGAAERPGTGADVRNVRGR